MIFFKTCEGDFKFDIKYDSWKEVKPWFEFPNVTLAYLKINCFRQFLQTGFACPLSKGIIQNKIQIILYHLPTSREKTMDIYMTTYLCSRRHSYPAYTTFSTKTGFFLNILLKNLSMWTFKNPPTYLTWTIVDHPPISSSIVY